MKTKKKILTLMMLLIFAFVFFIAITQMPAKTVAAAVGGTYCDTNNWMWCYAKPPNWGCVIFPPNFDQCKKLSQ